MNNIFLKTPQIIQRSPKIFSMTLKTRRTLTGEGELGERNVAIHAVIDEADAHTLGFNLHTRDQLCWHHPLALSAVRRQGKGLQRFSILKQPTGCLFQLAFKEIKRRSVLPVPTATQATQRKEKNKEWKDLLDSPREP